MNTQFRAAPSAAPPTPATAASGAALPTSIPEYLAQLRQSLAGADPAMLQDALYDAEEYLRSELAEHPGKSEADVIAAVASSYGAPDEVADIYRDTEVKVQTALRAPRPPRRASTIGRFFGVAADPRTYGALFYMLLSLATGIFYFTWTVTGASLSLGLLVLIVGVPLLLLFLASVRVLSLVEGRLVETLLDVRMPRRPLYADRDKPWRARIADLFTDLRTWSTMLYQLLMLPLGIVYFTLTVTLLSTSLALIFAPVVSLFVDQTYVMQFNGVDYGEGNLWWIIPLTVAVGVLLLFGTLHLLRGLGKLHGQLAKHMLVRI